MTHERADVLAVCESRRQVEWLVRRPSLLGRTGRFVAASPDAAWALEQHGISFIRLEDYGERRSEEDVERLLQEQIQWAQWVDAFLQTQIPEFRRLKFFPVRTYLVSIKNWWDTCIHRAGLLQALATRARLSSVLFFANREAVSFSEGLAIQGSALAASIPLWAAHHGIDLHAVPAIRGDRIWEIEYTHIGRGVRRMASRSLQGVRRRYLALHRDAVRPRAAVIRQGAPSGHPPPLLVMKQGYDLTSGVAEHVRARGVDLLDFDEVITAFRRSAPLAGDSQGALETAWERIIGMEEFWRPLGWQAWSLRALLEPALRHFWLAVIPVLWRSLQQSLDLFARRRPGAVVLATLGGAEEFGPVMAAHTLGVPVVMSMHGVSVGDLRVPTTDLLDRYFGQYILTYGTGQSAFLRSRPSYGDCHATPVAVGSARVDEVRRGGMSRRARSIRARLAGPRERPIVLYVPGVFVSNEFRFESNDFLNLRSFELRKAVAAIFSRRPDVRLVYKSFLSQGHDPTLEMLSQVCPGCTVIGDVPLTELQWAADVLVQEIPSSGMVEGLVTDKPVVLFADRDVFRMSDEARTLLRRRVTLAETPVEMIAGIETLLAEQRYAPLPHPDQEFLRRFVTHANDGESAFRAADAIVDVASGMTRPDDC